MFIIVKAAYLQHRECEDTKIGSSRQLMKPFCFRDSKFHLKNYILVYSPSLSSRNQHAAPTRSLRFNEQGYIIEKIDHSASYMHCSGFTYQYDSKNNLIIEYGYTSDNNLNYQRGSKYNEAGKKIEETGFDPAGNVYYRCTYTYDNKGNKIKDRLYFNVNVYLLSNIYDDYFSGLGQTDERYVNEGYIMARDSACHYITYRFDDKNKMIEQERELRFNDSIIERYKYTYEYGPNAELIAIRKTVDGLANKETRTFKYDGKGNKIEDVIESAEGSKRHVKKQTYKYDDNGRLIEKYEISGEKTTKYIYEYDKNGNMAKADEYFWFSNVRSLNCPAMDMLTNTTSMETGSKRLRLPMAVPYMLL
jgi:hypothetical protein